ncbi:transmembrane protein, putative [Medicago truncatula]|uniref:Transmembrane protein, putative n=1 Tax=Medicago truncatula TaxID=3880 RepID=A0A072UP98_MEDTR|nr:transmembrane protein, putative [Medicago truncatula]
MENRRVKKELVFSKSTLLATKKFIIIFVMNLGDCTITMAEILPFVNEFKVLKDYDLLGLPLPQLG